MAKKVSISIDLRHAKRSPSKEPASQPLVNVQKSKPNYRYHYDRILTVIALLLFTLSLVIYGINKLFFSEQDPGINANNESSEFVQQDLLNKHLITKESISKESIDPIEHVVKEKHIVVSEETSEPTNKYQPLFLFVKSIDLIETFYVKPIIRNNSDEQKIALDESTVEAENKINTTTSPHTSTKELEKTINSKATSESIPESFENTIETATDESIKHSSNVNEAIQESSKANLEEASKEKVINKEVSDKEVINEAIDREATNLEAIDKEATDEDTVNQKAIDEKTGPGVYHDVLPSNSAENLSKADEHLINSTQKIEQINIDEKSNASNLNTALSEPPQDTEMLSNKIVRIVLAESVYQKEPVNPLTFNITGRKDIAKKVYLFTEIKNMKGLQIEHQWWFQDKLITRKRFKALGNRWRCYSSKNLGTLHQGSWQVKVIGQQGKLLAKANFIYKLN